MLKAVPLCPIAVNINSNKPSIRLGS